MLPLLRLSLLLLVGAAGAPAQAYLEGVVRVRAGDVLSPLEGARVEARAGTPSNIVAAARSDSAGHYRLEGLPAGRVVIMVRHPRHYVIRAGEVENERLTLSCPESGACGELDFLLERTLVLEGWVVDPWGDPIAWVDARLLATAANDPPEPGERRRARAISSDATTDDRGYFRIHTLRPGSYSVALSVPAHRPPYSADPIPLQVEPGIDPAPLRLTMRAGGADRGFQLSGVIEGIEISPERPLTLAFVRARSQWGAAGGFGIRIHRETLTSNQFELRATRGDYVVYANPIPLPGSSEGSRGRALGKMRVDADRAKLILRPQPTASVRGRVEFDGPEPRTVTLWLRPLDDRGVFTHASARPPTFKFEVAELLPGRYEIVDTRGVFAVGSPEVVIPEGGTVEIDVVVSNNFAELSGLVRLAAESEDEAQAAERIAAQHTVGIRSPNVVRAASADQHGRFRFERLPPGDYEICAWSDPLVRVQSDGLWEASSDAVRRFTLEAGDQAEIVLTATP